MKRKCPVINNFQMNSPMYNEQGGQAESSTVLSLQIIIGVFVLLVHGTERSMQVESRALSLDTAEYILPWLTLRWVHLEAGANWSHVPDGLPYFSLHPSSLLMPLRQIFSTVYRNQMGTCSYVGLRKEG